MKKGTPRTVVCQICTTPKVLADVMPAELIHEPLLGAIRQQYPEWTPQGFVCHVDLNRLRARYFSDILAQSKGDLSVLEQHVVSTWKEQEILSKNINTEFEQGLTVGDRVADKIADFGGSWWFLMIFGGVLALWVAVNSIIVFMKPFDPYPFIFLNLAMSCLAAVQAPVIMMSQNRHESKDRLRMESDYRTNLKAELEIRYLHEKLDYLLTNHWQRLLEIQEIQMELMEELSRKKAVPRGKR